MENAVKTTLLLRRDVYQAMVQVFGKRRLSSAVNELMFKELIKPRTKDLFGVDKGMKPFVREHHDRY
ncbi:hypothetical protein HYY73_04890 [Candidatus Woesearchaeota archaeon]|nr:hypothetical protein [Candidatus Woesearchaeota archaeon]